MLNLSGENNDNEWIFLHALIIYKEIIKHKLQFENVKSEGKKVVHVKLLLCGEHQLEQLLSYRDPGSSE